MTIIYILENSRTDYCSMLYVRLVWKRVCHFQLVWCLELLLCGAGRSEHVTEGLIIELLWLCYPCSTVQERCVYLVPWICAQPATVFQQE